RSSLLRSAIGSLALAAAYYGAARLGLQLQFEATQATPVWPPSGLGFAALLLFGPSLSAGVLIGACLANLVDFHLKATGPGGWLGDATGLWIVAPLLVAWARATPAQLRHQMRVGGLLALGFLLVVCASTFTSWLEQLLEGSQAHALVPVLIKLQAYMLIPLLL